MKEHSFRVMYQEQPKYALSSCETFCVKLFPYGDHSFDPATKMLVFNASVD